MPEEQGFNAWLARGADQILSANRSVKRLSVGLIDAASCLLSVWISFMIRLGVWVSIDAPVLIFAIFQLLAVMIVFSAAGIYNNVFRFHGQKGLGQIARCCLIISIPSIAVFGYISVAGVPRTVSLIFPLVLFTLVALSRIVARFVLVEMLRPKKQRRRVVIYGAGGAGRQLALSLQHETSYHLVAYIDDDPDLAGQRLEGVPIIPADELSHLLADREVDLVLLAMPSLSRGARAAIVERLQQFEVHVQTLPTIRDIVSGEVSVSDLREIDITDLLARDPVTPHAELLHRTISGNVVLVTGAGGSIGSELCRQIVQLGPKQLVLFEMSESALFAIDQTVRSLALACGSGTDIRAELGNLVNQRSVDRLFSRYRPHTVFHAAAYKHVPLVEINAVAGVHNNVFGTLNCAHAAQEHGTERFVLISTDKAVRPTNVMGASKRFCELILQGKNEQLPNGPVFSMVRFGNVLGSSGSVVPQFTRQIAEGGPITLTHREIVRYFMTIPEAAELVIQAGAMAEGGEVYLLDMGEPVRIYDLARSMITMSGRTVRDESNPDGDIAIEEIGLRPGEKLFEELLISAEAQSTGHERIFVAREDHVDWSKLEVAIEELRQAIDDGDNGGIVSILSRFVAGYRTGPDASASGAHTPAMRQH